MRTIQLKNGTNWDRCRSCGRTWDLVTHSSLGLCRGCRRQENAINPSIQSCDHEHILKQELLGLLLTKETQDKYNYDISMLSFGSPKPVVHKCPECGLPKDNTPFKLFVQSKNLRHTKCKVKQTRRTNKEKYGVINSCNQTDLLQSRIKEKDNEIIKAFENEYYKVVKIDRQNKKEIVVHFLCPQRHEHFISYRAWKIEEQRCGKCFGNNGRISINTIKQSFESEKYQLLTQIYEDNNTELFYLCSKGHQESTSWKIWERGCRCPVCHPSVSKGELEVSETFKQFNPVRTRSIIPPYELDAYFPEHNLAIEYCGLYWHSDAQERIESSYHYKKMKMCNEKEIRLITIFEDEWQDNKEICVSRIGHALGITDTKIFARKCVIKSVSKEESNAFFKNNHLQSFTKNMRETFGLYYEGILVYAASVGLPSRFHTSQGKKILELKRMAPKLGIIVVGGASRLFKVIHNYAKTNGYQEIKSYCDMRWGTGGVYEKLGMTLQGQTHFTPHYTNGRIRQRNQSFAGKEIPKGWYKLYDCGHQTWSFTI